MYFREKVWARVSGIPAPPFVLNHHDPSVAHDIENQLKSIPYTTENCITPILINLLTTIDFIICTMNFYSGNGL
ncbi:hypothetical protein [Lacrimispora sp.]|uniref:hypothetical protein n=1 Tax=Lacrimispora sp. TaxID=2719234 RepID=UPI00286E0FE4|nr:hypothetical protein [Lacrimispora sp.]